MGLRGILNRIMYKDRLTVSRQFDIVDGENADDYLIETVYKDIPCKLSQYGKDPAGERRDREYAISADLRVCLDPKYNILPNDIMEVTHQGQTFLLNAAKPFKYPTHQEISVRRDSEA